MSNDLTLYRPSWQRLRVSCVAAYNPYGGFTSTTGTQDNINRLTNYVNDAMLSKPAPYTEQENLRMKLEAEEELACRVYRVYNLLTATHMGFMGQHLGGSPSDKQILEARENLLPMYNVRAVSTAADKFKWDVLEYELETLWREDNYWFQAIYADLKKRTKFAARKRRREVGVDDSATTRQNLYKFVGLCDKINARPQPRTHT